MGGPRKRITQDTFDEAVQENMEEFDMEAAEAVKSAVEEFELQGIDLTGIIKSATGGNVAGHPVARAVEDLAARLDAQAGSSCAAGGSGVQEALAALQAAVTHTDKQEAAQALAVAAKAGAAAQLVRCYASQPDAATLVASLNTLAATLPAYDNKEAFLEARGVEELCSILERHGGNSNVVGAAATVASTAASGHEENKCRCIDAGLADRLVAAVKEGSASAAAIQAICAAIRSFTTADDERPAASRAFQNARTLAKGGAALALLEVLQRQRAEPPELAAAVCSATKRLAANEEICKEFAEAGGVHTCMQVLRDGMHNAALVRSACSLLRQLANSDSIKESIVEDGGLDLLKRCVGTHSGSAPTVEQALGLLAALTLRNPANAERAAEAGCVDAVIEVMGLMGSNKNAQSVQWVQRQACMSIRNIVARNPGLRPVVLEKGAEQMLRKVKTQYPQACQDVGSAALRDLGFDDYNS
ncbi:hypothetical protein WJX72_001431 [[Myrmecia] bisecta]|uniref:Armadillo repeat-containing protein 6 n=1 Tax=[Myrmecia] bisecta TaxID=41462 RepID=A0AAW1PJC5_9CHLO